MLSSLRSSADLALALHAACDELAWLESQPDGKHQLVGLVAWETHRHLVHDLAAIAEAALADAGIDAGVEETGSVDGLYSRAQARRIVRALAARGINAWWDLTEGPIRGAYGVVITDVEPPDVLPRPSCLGNEYELEVRELVDALRAAAVVEAAPL